MSFTRSTRGALAGLTLVQGLTKHASAVNGGCVGQVEVVLGSATDSITQLAARGVRFDLAFLDADKGGYLGYYRQVCCQA